MDNLRYVHFHHFIDGSITNIALVTCYSTCDLSNSNGNVQDTNNPMDSPTDDLNSCCNSVSRTSGYSITQRGNIGPCTVLCKFSCNYISLQILILT